MKTTLYRANSRGCTNKGWLRSYHSFSFDNYYDVERMHFGVLQVLNDDIVAGGKGFGLHFHENMEIVTIPLSGALEHKDSMGNVSVIRAGEIQVMSAGTGIYHSEYNHSKEEEVHFLQIWIVPNKVDVKPRYEQISLSEIAIQNELYQILSPSRNDQGVWINQSAWFYMGDLSDNWQGEYIVKGFLAGVFVFIIEGVVEVDGRKMTRRDSLEILATDSVDIRVLSEAKILIIEVPKR